MRVNVICAAANFPVLETAMWRQETSGGGKEKIIKKKKLFNGTARVRLYYTYIYLDIDSLHYTQLLPLSESS